MTRGLLLALILAPAAVTVDVYPRVLIAGGTVRLRCSVPRQAENRQLDYGIEGLSASSVPLEGESAAVTRQVYLQHVPCGVGDAYCAVTRSDGSTRRAVQALSIAGCGEE